MNTSIIGIVGDIVATVQAFHEALKDHRVTRAEFNDSLRPRLVNAISDLAGLAPPGVPALLATAVRDLAIGVLPLVGTLLPE